MLARRPDPDVGAERELAAPELPPQPAATVWPLLAGGLVSAGLLAAIFLQLGRTSAAALAMLAQLSPAVFLSFALVYLAQPVADLVIYRRVWNLPVSGIAALFRKTAINEVVFGYSGELYLYVWARRRAGLLYAPFAAIKDVNILSSAMGAVFTLTLLVLAATRANSVDLVQLLRPVLWPGVAVMAVALGVLVFAKRVFALRAGDIVFVGAVHAARLTATSLLTILTWTLALPEVAIDVWIVLLAVNLLVARIPFLTNKALAAGNVVLLMLGPASPFAMLLAGLAVATLGAHLAVITVLGAQDLWRALRRR